MPIHIGNLETEVSVEPQSPPPSEAPSLLAKWREMERMQAIRDAIQLERLRTRSTGYDD